MATLATLMYRITNSRFCPHTGTCERVQDLTKSPFDMKWRHISLPSASKGMQRFSERADPVISPSLSMIHNCGSILRLKIALRLPPLPLGLSPKPFPSDFRRPSSFCAGHYTHTGDKVNHSPLYTFFWSPPNYTRSPDSTSSMAFVLQECNNTCTRLWIQSIKSALKRGSLAKALSYCRLKRSM